MRLENKTAALAVHYRNVPKKHQAAAQESILRLAAGMHGVRVLEGHNVVELIFSAGSKGAAAQRLIRRHPSALFVAIGDDETDEGMFETVNEANGISIRVGNPRTTTAARFLEPSIVEVRRFLERTIKKWRR